MRESVRERQQKAGGTGNLAMPFRHLSYGGRASCIESAMTPLGLNKPEIPTLVPEPPSGASWIHGITSDGYRP
jgi:hypothetical protein